MKRQKGGEKKVAKTKVYRLAESLKECRGRNPHGEMIRGRVGREVF